MGSYTDNLGLYKVNTETDGNDTFNIDTMMNENWDIIDAFSKGLRMKTYTNLSQIGLTAGSETIESILTAMPVNSNLYVEVGASNADIYPTQYGMFIAKKLSASRWFAEFYPKETTDLYVCSAKTENSTFTFYDWKKKADYDDIEEVKKSVSDGKTLVANAITAKGVTTATDATFQTMADNVALIETGIPGLSNLYYVMASNNQDGYWSNAMVSLSMRTVSGFNPFDLTVTSDSEIKMILIAVDGGTNVSGVSFCIIIPSSLTYGYFIKNTAITFKTNESNTGTIPLHELVMPGRSLTSSDLFGTLSSDEKSFTISLTKKTQFSSVSGTQSGKPPRLFLYAYGVNKESDTNL